MKIVLVVGCLQCIWNCLKINFCIVTSYSGDDLKKFKNKNTTYYLVPDKNCLEYSEESKKYYREIVSEFHPDIVHIHGTEYPRGLIFQDCNFNIPVVTSIQGLISNVSNVYYSNITFSEILKNITFRDILRRQTIFNDKKSFEKRIKYEREIIEKSNYVIRLNSNEIKLVLHSTSPLLNTYKEAMLGHIKLLSNKTNDVINYEVVNLTNLAREFKSTIISPTLYMKISEALKKNEKTILILNNKGYSTSITCRSCGHTLKCISCQVPLQFRKEKNELYCPACYRKVAVPKICPVCKNNKLSYDGFGMEKLEETVRSLFENKKIFVLQDSKEELLEEVIDNFNQNNLDILITSDTFSRSIDIENLSVVGIINLDVVLNTPSYNANHLAYSMLQHAKRLLNKGTMVIQTSDVKNIVLKNFILNDYDEYFYEELKIRETLQVEPLYEVNRILIKGDFKEVFIIANNIKKTILNINPHISVIGPSYNHKEKKVQLIVKHKDPNIKKIYMHIYEMFQKKDTMVIFDRYSKAIS